MCEINSLFEQSKTSHEDSLSYRFFKQVQSFSPCTAQDDKCAVKLHFDSNL
uniref:Uncharacterized protein n=1 Tax=Arundo donax TaxID=35708 RepID=A0A0A8YMA4_ARUDO